MYNYYWQLPDGRIWGCTEGCWAGKDVAANGALSLVSDIDQLRDRIRLYNGNLGELATIEDLRPGDDHELVDGQWMKARFSKKEFLLWCGLEQIIKLNATRQVNPMAETVYTLLMAAEFIDVTDPATVQMVQLLATEAAGEILSAEDVARILAGVKHEKADPGGD